MSYDTDDTICAIATAPSGAERGMVRISGPAAVAVAGRLFEASDGRLLETIRHTTALPGRVRIDIDASPRVMPCDVFLWPTNRSYTREPVAELHTVGSPPLVESLVAAACRAGARLAEPGEFTLRAFLAGRLDLTQAEAVLGVIDARGADDLNAAITQLAGGLARPLHQLREELLQLLAELEAGLDFVDEDIEFVSATELLERLQSAAELLGAVSQQMATRHIAGSARQIALVGPPNVGKSSLFNALVEQCGTATARGHRQSRALVSRRSGTTRDYLIATISLNGLSCELVDTAGVDTHSAHKPEISEIDFNAQALAVERRKRAAIRACCIDLSDALAFMNSAELRTSIGDGACDLVILTKSDLAPHPYDAADAKCGVPVVITSSRTGEGLEYLCDTLRRLLTRQDTPRSGQVIGTTADRCRESFRIAETSLQTAAGIVTDNGGNELVAVELRAALAELGKVVGAVYTDDLLDRIFRTFCIGK